MESSTIARDNCVRGIKFLANGLHERTLPIAVRLLMFTLFAQLGVAQKSCPVQLPGKNVFDGSPTKDSFAATLGHSVSGRVQALAVSADGTRLYAGTYSGVWRSDDSGSSWKQLISQDPAQGQNADDLCSKERPASLCVPVVRTIDVSKLDKDIVLGGTTDDTRRPEKSKNGIYRSTNGGNTWQLVHQFVFNSGTCDRAGGSPMDVGQVSFAPDDPNLVLAAGGCAVAISTNAGQTWVDKALPGGGKAWHVAIGERLLQVNRPPIRRVYAAGDSQMWYSQDGGNTWVKDGNGALAIFTVTFQSLRILDPVSPDRRASLTFNFEINGQHLTFPDVSTLRRGLPLATPINLPPTFTFTTTGTTTLHVGVHASKDANKPPEDDFIGRRPTPQSPAPDLERYFDSSSNYGNGPHTDTSTNDAGESFEVTYEITRQGGTIPVGFGDRAADCCGNSEQVLAVEPGHSERVYLAIAAASNGPSFFHQQKPEFARIPDGALCNAVGSRGCGEGSLWIGDYAKFDPNDPSRQAAVWLQLPSPPAYFGGSTVSGNVYVVTKPAGDSFLLFFSDRSHVHVSDGRPQTHAAWFRLDGRGISQSWLDNDLSNKLFVHVDPHALAVSSNFFLPLVDPPTTVPDPYNQSKMLGRISGGDVWMANDGGVVQTVGGSPTWRLGNCLATLSLINVALDHGPTATFEGIYFGTGDNDDFFSPSSTENWFDPVSDCGDCDPWFSDPGSPGRVMSFVAREQDRGFAIYDSLIDFYRVPNAAQGGTRIHIPCPSGFTTPDEPFECNAVSFYYLKGYRPIILTLPGEAPLDDGDYIVIRFKADPTNASRRIGAVLRAKNNISQIRSRDDWDSKAVQIGPDLPPNVDVVQASGGHTSTVFYVGDPGASMGVWRLALCDKGLCWTPIVPGGPPGQNAEIARRFFVNPYNPRQVYIVDRNAIKRTDGGGTWRTEAALDASVTENGAFAYDGDGAVIKDMVFVRNQPTTRFAIGNAGVYYKFTNDTDTNLWFRLLTTNAVPSRPTAGAFDSQTLYLASAGRGLLYLGVPFCPERKSVRVTFLGLKIIDTADPDRRAKMTFSFQAGEQGPLHFPDPITLSRGLPLGSTITLPSALTLTVNRGDACGYPETLSVEIKASKDSTKAQPDQTFAGGRPLPSAPLPQVVRSFNGPGFGQGTHTDTSNAFDGEYFEISYRIDVQ